MAILGLIAVITLFSFCCGSHSAKKDRKHCLRAIIVHVWWTCQPPWFFQTLGVLVSVVIATGWITACNDAVNESSDFLCPAHQSLKNKKNKKNLLVTLVQPYCDSTWWQTPSIHLDKWWRNSNLVTRQWQTAQLARFSSSSIMSAHSVASCSYQDFVQSHAASIMVVQSVKTHISKLFIRNRRQQVNERTGYLALIRFWFTCWDLFLSAHLKCDHYITFFLIPFSS